MFWDGVVGVSEGLRILLIFVGRPCNVLMLGDVKASIFCLSNRCAFFWNIGLSWGRGDMQPSQ